MSQNNILVTHSAPLSAPYSSLFQPSTNVYLTGPSTGTSAITTGLGNVSLLPQQQQHVLSRGQAQDFFQNLGQEILPAPAPYISKTLIVFLIFSVLLVLATLIITIIFSKRYTKECREKYGGPFAVELGGLDLAESIHSYLYGGTSPTITPAITTVPTTT